jgi:hypothetical protein
MKIVLELSEKEIERLKELIDPDICDEYDVAYALHTLIDMA